MASSVAVVLVVPVGAIHPKTGGGQRTAILFKALQRIGEVSVVILSEKPVVGAEVFFDGAKRVVSVTTRTMAAPSGNAVIRSLQAVGRFLRPSHTFAAQAAVSAAVHNEFEQRGSPAACLRLVAARYARTFAIAGLKGRPEVGLLACLDVDDRDDQKIDIQIRQRLGNLLGIVARLLWKRRFVAALHKTLSRASILFIAKAEDRFDFSAPPQVVMPNVPFLLHGPDALVPVSRTGEVLVFVGSAGHRPNVAGVAWFLRSCWPSIRSARPHAKVRVVGMGDWSALPTELVAQPGVHIIGTVDDLSAEYALARAAICPIREGAGSQIKVIEACAFARPVVTTTFAAGGFGPEIERALSVAADAASFATSCIDLLADHERASRQGETLQALQKTTHSRAAVEDKIVSTLSDLIAQARTRMDVPA